MKAVFTTVAALLLSLFALTNLHANPANVTSSDEFVIHHNAITTDMLTPEIARHYGLIRSRNRALLNVAVIKQEEGTTGTPMTGEVRAYTTNLLGQQRRLYMREVQEPNAIYYISDFLVRNRDHLNFHIDVRPEGATNFIPVIFTQEFFTE
jgi:hypothetical protein